MCSDPAFKQQNSTNSRLEKLALVAAYKLK